MRNLDLCTWQFADQIPYAAAALDAAYAFADRADEALASVAEIIEKVRSHRYIRSFFFLRCGEIHLSAGVIDEAASHARAVLDLSRRSGARGS